MTPQIREISSELAQVTLNDFQETPKKLSNGLAEIREWLKEHPYIKSRTDDQFFVTFLRGCKYDMTAVKEKLESFYTVRAQLPEFFTGKNPKDERLLELLNAGCVLNSIFLSSFLNNISSSIVLPLPNTATPASPRVVIIRFTSYDPRKYKMSEIVSLIGIVFDILSEEDDNSTVCGQVSDMT